LDEFRDSTRDLVTKMRELRQEAIQLAACHDQIIGCVAEARKLGYYNEAILQEFEDSRQVLHEHFEETVMELLIDVNSLQFSDLESVTAFRNSYVSRFQNGFLRHVGDPQ
jgi:hypothetical protein